ncbi:MAG TPA: polyprenol monophosphomannose synthase [candidate division Zixibacteria bacterium]|nr:polyprenol monophosphomannose synthase [candidate division Zixibacteria bacterium]
MSKTVIILPTYNEANNLPVLAAELWALQIPELSILVVDDNSPDGTGEIADELAQRRSGDLHVIHQPEKAGLGRAYVAGFRWAMDQSADYIIQMDSDFSHSPPHILQMLEEVQNVDLVVGSRYVTGGRVDEHWSFGRYLLSWWANAVYTKIILNLKVKDATSGFKCWRATAIQQINLDSIKSNGYSFQFEMAYLAERLGFRIVEIPIYFEDRRIGRSKMTIPVKVEAIFRAWEIRWRYRNLRNTNPPSNATTN